MSEWCDVRDTGYEGRDMRISSTHGVVDVFDRPLCRDRVVAAGKTSRTQCYKNKAMESMLLISVDNAPVCIRVYCKHDYKQPLLLLTKIYMDSKRNARGDNEPNAIVISIGDVAYYKATFENIGEKDAIVSIMLREINLTFVEVL